jgi:hypothetical protein
MEQKGKALDMSRGLIDNTDIDRTLDEFVEYFHREFLPSIPRNILADKRLLVKHVREFYRARGSAQSYRFLFRAIFNKEIELYYPADNILRASDGRWVRETVIRGIFNKGVPELLDGRQIFGKSSGASAFVQSVLRVTSLGLELIQLTVENVTGSFQDDEIITDNFGNEIIAKNTAGSLDNIVIQNGGAFHVREDKLNINGLTSGIATGIISEVTDSSGMTFKILKGGSGYRIGNTTISISGGDPVIPARFRIVSLSNTQSSTINSDFIFKVLNVPINNGATFATGGANSAALTPTFAAANASSTILSALTFQTVQTGSIDKIYLETPGAGYKAIPSVSLVDDNIAVQNIPDDLGFGGIRGENAQIEALPAPGSISKITILSTDVNFLRDDIPQITNISRGTANTSDTYADIVSGQTRETIHNTTYGANGSFVIRSNFELPGRYLDTRGFLSWNNVLQDNDYYQQFSYVIRVSELVNDYRNFVKNLIHPAGTKMFGEYSLATSADFGDFDVDSITIIDGTEMEVNSIIPVRASISEPAVATDTFDGYTDISLSISESVSADDSLATQLEAIIAQADIPSIILYFQSDNISTWSSTTISAFQQQLLNVEDTFQRTAP